MAGSPDCDLSEGAGSHAIAINGLCFDKESSMQDVTQFRREVFINNCASKGDKRSKNFLSLI